MNYFIYKSTCHDFSGNKKIAAESVCPGQVIIIMILFLLISVITGEEYVGSHINKDTKWNAEDGPYLMDRDLVIDKGANLTIGPGVKVIIRKPKIYDTITQFDATDSQLVSIKVLGALNCVGKKDRHISFVTTDGDRASYGWYGFVFDKTPGAFAEIAYTEIVNAYRAVSIRESDPIIRNNIIEYNHIGIYCSVNGNGRIYNNVISRNLLAGIHIREANPHIANNIIAFNKNNGVMCDAKSKINLEYNCIFGNADGDFLDCTPELGVPVKKSKKDSLIADFAHNIIMDPIFKGSAADSLAQEHDVSLPTDKSRIKDTALANVYYEDSNTSAVQNETHFPLKKYELSPYSPCISNGLPDKEFNNSDGTQNTMGIWGGPEYFVPKAAKSSTPKKAAAKPAKKKEGGGHGGGHKK